jgi:hypothetical protein
MTDQPILGGSRGRGSGRAPSRFPSDRVCTEPSCHVRVSMYNRNDTCFQHSPIRFPRVRGRIPREIPSVEAQ